VSTLNQIKKEIQKENVSFVYLQFSDLTGQLKNVVVDAGRIGEVIENGVWFDGSSVEGFARIAESDMLLKPDRNTFAVIPWSPPERRSARMICDIYRPSGRKLTTDPRTILKTQIDKLKKMGFSYFTGAEVEFYLIEREFLPEIRPHDRKSYFDYTPHSRASTICESTMKTIAAFGAIGETHHHEVGRGQHEIDLRYDSALKTADNIMALKMALKAHANGSGLKVTWMPKPIFNFPGNGMHIHQSLWKNNKNIFYDPKSDYSLSKISQYFLAGQLSHAKAISAIVSPTVNSYKRLVPGFEAPVYICWGQNNRSALIRIPKVPKEKAHQSTRMEYRAPDPSANPYLAFAALLAAGMDGIEKKILPPKPADDNVYFFRERKLAREKIETLPTTLKEAIDALEQDQVISSIFGAGKDQFLEIKRQEWKEFSCQVSSWEIEKYL